MTHTPPSQEIPTLTEVLIPGAVDPGAAAGVDLSYLPSSPRMDSSRGVDLLGPVPLDVQALEERLLEQLIEKLQGSLEQRVHASVVPAVSLLADRIAYKAAQEVAANLAERMRDDLKEAVHRAVDEALKSR